MAAPLRLAPEDRQCICREPARELGGGKCLPERSRLPRPHWPEAVFALLLGGLANGRKGLACERIGGRFGPDRAEIVDQPASDPAREAAGQEVREHRMAVPETVAMYAADRCFWRVQIGRAELHGARAKNECGGDSTSVSDAARRDHGDRHSICDLREQRTGPSPRPDRTRGTARCGRPPRNLERQWSR